MVNDCNITHDVNGKLLRILKASNCLEIDKLLIDPQTLLCIPGDPTIIRKVPPGEQMHSSLERALKDRLRIADYKILSNFILIEVVFKSWIKHMLVIASKVNMKISAT